MGQEIGTIHYSSSELEAFAARLQEETLLLEEMLAAGAFDDHSYVTGFELEAWLLDHNLFPAPINQVFLERMDSPLVVPELSRFNIELNGTPQQLQGDALRRIETELEASWRRCLEVAHDLEATLILIGTLPTIRNSDLCMANISQMKRYHALNTQILKARGGRPIPLEITGRETLKLSHDDVMLEAATTSFQVHLQTPLQEFTRHFNASIILSAPIVAAAANSPYLFETSLWEETRIPLFEQSVDTGSGVEERRVCFGSGYLDAPDAFFRENLTRYPVLLPIRFEEDARKLAHLRLHNGTIWRWNRPLVGNDRHGQPHLRIEHRVLPAGPSIADMIANAALYLGATRFLATQRQPPEAELGFEQARSNFYAAAKDGLAASVQWLDGAAYNVRDLLLDEVLPMAHEGLRQLGVNEDDRDYYLGILRARIGSGQNGAAWQRIYIETHGRDFFRMTAAYLQHQRSGMPVHQWEI
jgi:hypothetical protein